jgi:predicted lipid-binding transport protein (Tim44 family)
MFPVLVTVHNADQLRAVHALLTGESAEAAPAPAPAPAKATKPRAAAAAAPAPTPAPAPATAPAGPAKLSAAGQAFLQGKLSAPVMELSMKDEPAMKAIVAEYGVERVALIPEALFPEVLEKVLKALDPGAAERARLEALDKSRSLI